MTDWAKLGRNNKNRGRAFEKRFAALMGWTWVGTVRYTLQEGDVIDGFWSQGGYWVAECKTQQRGASDNISIKDEYIDQLAYSCARTGRFGLIAIHLVGLRDDYVILPIGSMISMRDRVSGIFDPDVTWNTKTRGKGSGFVVQRSWMKATDWKVAQINVLDYDTLLEGDPKTCYWWMMRDTHFKAVLDLHRLHKAEDHEDRADHNT